MSLAPSEWCYCDDLACGNTACGDPCNGCGLRLCAPCAKVHQCRSAPRPGQQGQQGADPLVMYVVLRRDLGEKLQWPLGSVVAQGAHAAVAVIAEHGEDEHVREYTSPGNLPHMRKVALGAKDEAQLLAARDRLHKASLAFHLWVEQPENIPTCLATKPYPKSAFGSTLKGLQLLK